MANKQDSNLTGLRYAEESAVIGVLPGGSPIFWPLEPNSYDDFGSQIATVARNPINPGRQRKKGVTTDLDASGGFEVDLVQTSLVRLMQGFFFADLREKPSTAPMNAAALALTATTTTTYTAASGLAIFAAGDLLLAAGFNLTQNNGVKLISAAAAGSVTTTGLAVETPPAAARLDRVGFQFGSAEVDIVIVSGLPRLNRASGTKDFTTFGIVPGEWIFVGGDLAAEKFVGANNSGFARVKSVAVTYLEFDKTTSAMTAETGTSKTIRIFFSNVLKNETGASIKRRTYHIERTLGNDGSGTMSEYLKGAVANEMSLSIAQADKALMSMSFVAIDNEQRTGTEGVKTGTRPSALIENAFNTSSDFSRIKMALVTAADACPTPLFGYLTELELTVNNGITPNKAIGVLGAFDVSAGTFEVGGSLTAYFSDITAVQAVRNNSDVTIDCALVKNNAGLVFDIPLLSLGDGRLNVEQDQPILLPLENNAAESGFGHTFLLSEFRYLPTLADL